MANALGDFLVPAWQSGLAQTHFVAAANPANDCLVQWGHFMVAALESIPLVGALIALIDLVISCFFNCFHAPAHQPLPPHFGPPPPPPIPNHSLVWREPPVTRAELDAAGLNLAALDADGRTILYRAMQADNPNIDLISWLLEHNAPYSAVQPRISIDEVLALMVVRRNFGPVVIALLQADGYEDLLQRLEALARSPDNTPAVRVAGSILETYHQQHVQPYLPAPTAGALPFGHLHHVAGLCSDYLQPQLDFPAQDEIAAHHAALVQAFSQQF